MEPKVVGGDAYSVAVPVRHLSLSRTSKYGLKNEQGLDHYLVPIMKLLPGFNQKQFIFIANERFGSGRVRVIMVPNRYLLVELVAGAHCGPYLPVSNQGIIRLDLSQTHPAVDELFNGCKCWLVRKHL